MMAVNQYTFIDCDCGLKLKIPPEYKEYQVECPKCGRIHQVNK
jgi:heat shock protein HtpX